MESTTDHGEDAWEIFWVFNQWHYIYDSLKEKLPPWAYLKMVDDSRPLEDQVQNASVLIPTTGLVSGAAIRAAPKLRLIAQPATGHNNIDVDTASSSGIPVCTAPGVNAASVAESALMMLLMLAKRPREQCAVFQEGGLGRPLGVQLAGKTLGIVGMGAIGKRMARSAEALDMHVLPITSHSPRAEFEAMLKAAHAISLHCPLTPSTSGMLGCAEFGLMRPGMMIVNYARGEVIDKEALLEALQSGRVAGAGLDVHWGPEPTDPSHPLYQHPNVIATPHAGVCSDQVVDVYASLLCENIVRRHDGRELLHQLV